MTMIARLAFRLAKPAARPVAASVPGRCVAFQVRFSSDRPLAAGSKGRKIPFSADRATAPAASLRATLTIRVSHRCPPRELIWAELRD